MSPIGTLRPAILCIGGVLQYVDKQFKPLRPVLRRYGDIEYFSYKGTRFAPKVVQKEVADRIREHVLAGRPVILIGASLGGMQTPYIVAQLEDIDAEVLQRLLMIVVIDAPYGMTSLSAIPKVIAWLVAILTLIPLPAWLNSNLGKWILDKMAVAPKEANIDVRYVDDADAYRQYVIQESLEGLRGHYFTLFVSQLAWMMNKGGDRMPLDALSTLDVTYVACIGPNDTVRQPEASDAWWPYVTRVKQVKTAHCAFLEQQETFLQLFKDLLGHPHKQ